MLNKAVRIGVESPELRAMIWQRGLTIVSVVVAVLGSAAWVLLKRAEEPQYVDPTDVVSDAFDCWEQPAVWPNELEVADSVSCTLTAFTRSADSLQIFHSSSAPTSLPNGWKSQAWQGGWILGASLGAWEVNPGLMAVHWQPRSEGRTVQMLLRDGTLESSFERFESEGKTEKLVTQIGGAADQGKPLLPQQWETWYDRVAADTDVESAAVGAYPVATAYVPDSLEWLVDGPWLTCSVDGVRLSAYSGMDSMAAVQIQGSWENGVWYIPAQGEESLWSRVPAYESGGSEVPAAFDFARNLEGESRTGRALVDGRLLWTVTEEWVDDGTFSTPAAAEAGASFDASISVASGVLGYARNHRSGKRMELVAEENRVVAREDGREMWKIEIESGVLPEVWEVDLYRNGKYQVAIGAGRFFHVIDVLGREAKGFPKRWSTGFSAFAVFDYDKNRQFRFLMAAPNGEVFNFRKEGERTPGWKFKAQSGRYIISLSHLRIGPRDYIFAGQDDGSVRILDRTGEDRFRSAVRVPVGQSLAFRLGKDLASSTVLYVDEAGWVQERTIGFNEPVGLSQMTRGLGVRVEDRTGDGIPEVIVSTQAGEELWDAGNQRLAN